jgi:tRNA1Val (adenine37-N6)-methyltransferase
MKVSTLACIQGAWLPDFSPKYILDIGAGSGLLTLMAAQKYHSPIDAVEIESEAYLQLKENIAQSLWKDRIHTYHDDIRSFAKYNSKCYDFIISNPPFFENQLKSNNPKINQAKHETGLTMIELIKATNQLLTNTGKISILLPPIESERLVKLCMKSSLFPSSQLVISDKENKSPKGVVTILSKINSKPSFQKLFIKNKTGQYSSRFNSLLKDYYLNL